MSWSQAYVVEVLPPVWVGGGLKLSWVGNAPAGLAWQVYLDGLLAWHGWTTRCHVAWPTGSWPTIDIGTVAAADARTSFADLLAPRPVLRASLAWQGGTYLDASGNRDVQGFRVYGEATPGGGIDYTKVLADIPAYTARLISDGFGLGGFGLGSFGLSPASYQWTSGPLTSGTWAFAVTTYGSAGSEGSPQLTSATIAAPPRPPAAFAGTTARLQYADAGFGSTGFGGGGFGTSAITLAWNPSPDL